MNTDNEAKVNPTASREMTGFERTILFIEEQQARIKELTTDRMVLANSNQKLTREYHEVRDAYMEVSEKNSTLSRQNAALRVALRNLMNEPPKTEAGPEVGAVPDPKSDTPDTAGKPFEERRGCGCGDDVFVSVVCADELPASIKAVLEEIMTAKRHL